MNEEVKFKVGDTVFVRLDQYLDQATVIEIISSDSYRVEYLDGRAGPCNIYFKFLFPASPRNIRLFTQAKMREKEARDCKAEYSSLLAQLSRVEGEVA